MTYQERSAAVSLITTLLILGYFSLNLLRIIQNAGLNQHAIFTLWATIIVLSIIVTILANILAQILGAIVNTVATGEEEKFVSDERDKLIELKGTRNAYVVFGLGVFLSMITMVLNQSPLVLFNLLVFCGFCAEIVSSVSRLLMYRRGV
jgi:hypothetical protein